MQPAEGREKCEEKEQKHRNSSSTSAQGEQVKIFKSTCGAGLEASRETLLMRLRYNVLRRIANYVCLSRQLSLRKLFVGFSITYESAFVRSRWR